jgi:2-polyprenyl-3-methyl-5-hydroxy-6-metoxy-1,4-benzoquinol methylase
MLVSRGCVICGTYDSTHVFTKKGFELVRCLACDLAYVANPPTHEALQRQYSFEHGYQRKYADTRSDVRFEIGAARKHLAYLQRYKTAGHLLDIGCSAGFFLAEARAAGWDVSGLELSEDTAQIAREKVGVDVTTGVLHDGMFRAASFDAVTMWDVIEHVADPVSMLISVSRILKRDGVLLMETPNIDGLFPRLSYRVAERLNYWPHPEPPYHLFQFSKKTVRRLLEIAGLRTLRIHDRLIPLSYSFGTFREVVRSPKQLPYVLVFASLAALGPTLGQGDSLVVAAQRAEGH